MQAHITGVAARPYVDFHAALWSATDVTLPKPAMSSTDKDTEMITLRINGQDRSYDGDPAMPLLWYIRDELGLTGTKFGCGQALCGACTIHLDGTAVRSCQTSLSDAAGKAVTTIEGLSPDGMHPVQVAWRELNVAQCGYCQSGQIMQAASLLKDTPNPTDDDIDSIMSGNICRCGTYPRIRAAIKQAAATQSGTKQPATKGAVR